MVWMFEPGECHVCDLDSIQVFCRRQANHPFARHVNQDWVFAIRLTIVWLLCEIGSICLNSLNCWKSDYELDQVKSLLLPEMHLNEILTCDSYWISFDFRNYQLVFAVPTHVFWQCPNACFGLSSNSARWFHPSMICDAANTGQFHRTMLHDDLQAKHANAFDPIHLPDVVDSFLWQETTDDEYGFDASVT